MDRIEETAATAGIELDKQQIINAPNDQVEIAKLVAYARHNKFQGVTRYG